MKRPTAICPEIELDLIATATNDADPGTAGRVEDHASRCAPCAEELLRYRAVDAVVARLRGTPVPADQVTAARARLERRLERIRPVTVSYRIFPSPLGNLLIALSDRGVALVEYLGEGADVRQSRLAQIEGVEAVEDGAAVEVRYRELIDYLEGRRTRLEWPLDLRFVRSEFHRHVLEATSAIPYGAVTSYAGLACEVGKPSAARAVAQALRWNPLPIVIPCHRVVGTSGALTGYAGDKIGLKEQLLVREGVPTVRHERAARVPREDMYLADPGSTEYCRPSCSWVGRAAHPHRFRFFGSRERAEAAGLAPCGDCRPDLEPARR
jgi:methylated-DNA-[protein]-cysteine S-methyltransferase